MDAMMPQFSAAGLIDPDTMSAIEESVQDAIKEQVELQTKPMHPKWYKEKDHPKPDPGRAFSHRPGNPLARPPTENRPTGCAAIESIP